MNDDAITKKDRIVFGTGIVITILIVSLSTFLFFLSLRSNRQLKTVQTLIETPTPSVEPSVVDYRKNKVVVSNASKTPGLAKKYADKLEKIGYANLTTKNYEQESKSNLLIAPENSQTLKDDLRSIGIVEYEYKVGVGLEIVVIK